MADDVGLGSVRIPQGGGDIPVYASAQLPAGFEFQQPSATSPTTTPRAAPDIPEGFLFEGQPGAPVPAAEELLDRATQGGQNLGNMSLEDKWREAQKVMFQTGQGALGNAPQNIVENPMTAMMAGLPGVQAKAGAGIWNLISGLTGNKPIEAETTAISDKYMNPQTTEGKIIGGIGNLATGFLTPGALTAGMAPKVAVAGGKIAGRGAGGLSKIFSGFGRNLPKEVSAAEQNLRMVQRAAPIKAAARAEKVRKVAGRLKATKMAKASGEAAQDYHIADALEEAASKLKGQDAEAGFLRNLANKYKNPATPGHFAGESLDNELNAISGQLSRRSQGLFYDAFKTKTEKMIPKFWEAKAPYARAMDAKRGTKALRGQKVYSEVAKGKLDPDIKAMEESLRWGGRTRPTQEVDAARKTLEGLRQQMIKQGISAKNRARSLKWLGDKIANAAIFGGLGYLGFKKFGGNTTNISF